MSQDICCFVLDMNYLEVSKIDNGFEDSVSYLSLQSQLDV